MARLSEQIVVLVVGGVASGKTEFLKKTYSVEQSVLFRPGRVLRDAAGTGWMLSTKNPNAPVEADHLVLSLFRSFLRLSNDLGRTLICDGFPRTVAQAIAMRDICSLADLNVNIDLKWMLPDVEMASWMFDARNDEVFDNARLAQSMKDSMQVVEWFRALTPSMALKCRVEEVRFGLKDRKVRD